MRIAVGTVEEKMEGGKGKLTGCLQAMKDDFSGYVFVKGESKGYVFVLSGIVRGAVLEGATDIFGREALEKIIWVSEQREAQIEIHRYPQVNVIFEYLPESRVEKKDLLILSSLPDEEPTEDIRHLKRMFPQPPEFERIPTTYTPLKSYLEEELKERHEQLTGKLKEGYKAIPVKQKAEVGQDEEAKMFAEKLKTLLAEDMKEEQKVEVEPIMEKELREILGDKILLKTDEDEAEKKKKEKVLAKVLKGAPVTLKRREFEDVIVIPEEEPAPDPIERLREEDESQGDAEKLLLRLNVPLSIMKKKKTEE